MKFLTLFLTSIVLISCGATVSYDYDAKTDFSSYKAYNFYPDISSGLSNLDNNRIIKATDSILQYRGFVKSESPDFLINFFAKEFVSQSNTVLGIGFGSGGIGISGGIPVGGDIINQKLTIDFINKKTDNLIWQAVGNDALRVKTNPKQKTNYYFELISTILKKFPPKK